jgi:hypothetical protein
MKKESQDGNLIQAQGPDEAPFEAPAPASIARVGRAGAVGVSAVGVLMTSIRPSGMGPVLIGAGIVAALILHKFR